MGCYAYQSRGFDKQSSPKCNTLYGKYTCLGAAGANGQSRPNKNTLHVQQFKKNIQYMSTCNTCRHLLPQSNLSLELWSLPAMMSSICSKEASSMKLTTDVMLKNYLILYFNQHCTQIQIPYV